MSYKVLHISSSDFGGAGIAAYRLNKALRDYGINSKMLCLNKYTSDASVYKYQVSLIDRLLGHLPIPFRQNKYNKLREKIKGSYESITFPEAIFDISNHSLIEEADIINLHWVGGMLNYPMFFRKIKKPIVWTLHDMNPFMGFAHYQGDYLRNEIYKPLDDKVQKIKIKAYSNHKSIYVVNLCEWMYNYSSRSEAFKNRHHEIIPNSIDLDVFKAYNKQQVRSILQIPDNKPVIMFCCQSIDNVRKGYDLLEEAMSQISHDCIFLVVGKTKNINGADDANVKIFGTVSDERYMALLYSAADVFVLPSREDNLPNTMLESLCCGTPVITFVNGGMKDVIVDGENGSLVATQTGASLASAINKFIINRKEFNTYAIARKAHSMFSPACQANSYDKLYTTILV